MYFIKCTVTRPGIFDNRQINFTPGINIIKGKNGSGKTFLIKSLVEAFLNLTGKGKNEILRDMYLDLCFSASEKGNFRFRYLNRFLTVFRLNGEKEKRIADYNSDNETLEGSPEQNDFLPEKYFSEDEGFVPSPSDIAGIKQLTDYEAIKKCILSDVSGFFEKYPDIRSRYMRDEDSDAPVFKIISEQKARLNNLNREIEIIRIKNQRFDKLKKEKKTLEEEILSLNRHKENQILKKMTLEQVLQNLSESDLMEQKKKNSKQNILAEKDKLSKIRFLEKDAVPMLHPFHFSESFSKERLDKIQECYSGLINNNEKKVFLEDRAVRNSRSLVRLIVLSMLSAAAACIVFFMPDVPFLKPELKELIFKTITGLTCAGTFSCLLCFRKKISNKKEYEAFEKEKAAITERMAELMDQKDLVTDKYSIDDLFNILLTFFEDYMEYRDTKEEIDSIKSSLSSPDRLERMNQELQDADLSINRLRTDTADKLSSIGIQLSSPDPEEIRKYMEDSDRETGELDESIKTKEEILAKINSETDVTLKEEDDSLVKEREKIWDSLSRLEEKKETMFLISDILTEAIEAQEKHRIKTLADNVLKKFNTLTGSQFADSVTEKTAEAFIRGYSSSGTLSPVVEHSLLLALKLALTEMGPETKDLSPLILDDPFLLMDDSRIGTLMEQLEGIAGRRQVLIFTNRVPESWKGEITEL